MALHRDAILFSGMMTFPMRHGRYWGITTGEDRLSIDVYDLPEFKSEWDKFSQKHNDFGLVGDYVDEQGGDGEHADARATSALNTQSNPRSP